MDETFGSEGIDYAILQKIYGSETGPDSRYSPATVVGVRSDPVFGNPDPKHVSTSIVERSNLTLRMSCCRFTRLTNAFSKKVENLEHAVALHFFHYNFIRPHGSLKGLTPAQRVGIADHRWTIEELVGWLQYVEAESN